MKRKFSHEGDPKPVAAADGKQRVGSNGIDEALKHSVVNIFRSLKLAASFEGQKLGRRKKQARDENAEDQLSRLQEEEALLKGFELYDLAEYQFYKTLIRIKSVVSKPAFPSYVAEKIESSKQQRDKTYLNVSARLFKSTYVMEAVDQAVKSIYQVMDIPEGPRKKKRLRKADFENDDEAPISKPPERAVKATEYGRLKESDVVDIVASSECSDLEDQEARLSPVTKAQHSNALEEDGIFSAASSESDSSSPSGLEHTKGRLIGSKISKQTSVHAAPKSTAFLPSLATGYFSGSESDGSPAEDVDELKPRKNRRGQRARQAIAELKYGSRANHLKKERSDRDYGWDRKRGAQDESSINSKRGRGKIGQALGRGRDKRDSRPNSAQDQTQNPQKHFQRGNVVSQAPLHPSWEAARKQKEQKGASTFKGKKVVFD